VCSSPVVIDPNLKGQRQLAQPASRWIALFGTIAILSEFAFRFILDQRGGCTISSAPFPSIESGSVSHRYLKGSRYFTQTTPGNWGHVYFVSILLLLCMILLIDVK
jgi:hypothetical protein